MSRRKRAQSRPATRAKAACIWQRWWAEKGPVFRFGAGFIALVALFSTISLSPFLQSFLTGYLEFDARLASIVLNWLGQQTRNTGATIVSSRFAVTVLSECSANEFVVFLWAGFLAFPTTLRCKITGIVVGTLGVVLVNLVRIVTLFMVGAYRPHFFTTVHEELWPGLFVIVMILFVAGWTSWTTRKKPADAAA